MWLWSLSLESSQLSLDTDKVSMVSSTETYLNEMRLSKWCGIWHESAASEELVLCSLDQNNQTRGECIIRGEEFSVGATILLQFSTSNLLEQSSCFNLIRLKLQNVADSCYIGFVALRVHPNHHAFSAEALVLFTFLLPFFHGSDSDMAVNQM